MGRLKELLDKEKAGKLSEIEKAELDGLKKDAEEIADVPQGSDDPVADADEDLDEQDEDEAIDEASEKLAKATMKKLQPLADLAEKLSKTDTTQITTSEHKFIVDPEMGKVSTTQLDEVKVEVPGRKSAGKKFYEVSRKTLHWIEAMVQDNREKLQLLTEGTAAAGGYLVPDDFLNILVEDKRDMVVMRQLATIYPVSTDTIHLPTLGSRPRAFWRSEAAVKSTTTVGFGEITLTPYSLAAIVTLSNELVSDARLGGSIVSIVGRLMARALAEEEDNAFWTGSGSGQPTGVNTYTYATVAAGAGASDSARADALIRATFVLNQGYRDAAVWVGNFNTLANIAKLKDSQNNYLLDNLGTGDGQTLRGKRIYEQNDIEDGVLFFGDFSYYAIADREGISIDTSQEATVAGYSAFERNLTHVRAEERVDGEMTLTEAVVEVTGLGGA